MIPYLPFKTVLVFLFIILTAKVGGQDKFRSGNNISYVTIDNGLLYDNIDFIHKDSRGFLWVATEGGGLSRYDGYEFIHYNMNTPVKLKCNFINSCCEDAFGRLWITSDEGIDILDLATNKTVHIQEPQEMSIFRQPASKAIKDSKGNIWFYCNYTVYKITFDDKGNISKTYSLLPASPDYPDIAIKDIDEDGNVWIGVGNKVSKVYTGKDGLYAVPVSPQLEFEEGLRIRALCVKENEIWIGSEIGLMRYNRNEEIVKRYLYDGTAQGLTQNFITDMAVNSEKLLLVSTFKGLNIYNPVTDDFEQVMMDSKGSDNHLNSNFINCMMVDGDITWIGTATGGLNKIIPHSLNTHNYTHDRQNPHSLPPNPVNAIFEDEDETLWVGIVESGLNKKSKGSDDFINYTTQNSGLSHNSVSVILKDNRKQMWIGTWGFGITVFDTEHSALQAKKYFTEFPLSFIGSLCYDSVNDLMWIGTGWGIYYYDYKTDHVYSPFPDESIANQIHSSLGALIDPYGQLWMGCSAGTFVFDLNSRQEHKFSFRHLKYKLDDPESCLGEKINGFLLDSDSVLWIGSNGNGLYRHIPNKDGSIGTFINYNTGNGLISNTIYGILEDKRKHLWISTNNGLTCFDTSNNIFSNYRHSDGIAGNKFYWNAYANSQTGLLYFGGVDGLTVINPLHRKTKTIRTEVTLTKLSVMNKIVQPGESYIDTDISIAKTIYLHERDKLFSLEFAALNFYSPATATYSYCIDGFDKKWIDVPASRPFANYTNLPAGKYTFRVKYSIDGIDMDSAITAVQIIVKPFFYKTIWFISLMIVLAICLVVYLYMQRIHLLQKQKEHLYNTVEERTLELKEQKKLLEKHTIDRISFLTNITHEFRNPITLIIGPVERALKLSSNPQVIEQLQFVERNSKFLLSLVNQLMDFHKVESGNIEIVQTKSDFDKFISGVIQSFAVMTSERHIILHQYIRMDSPEFMFDQDAMRMIITNLISNALKFTPDGGVISLYVAIIKESDNNEKLYICVRDTGTGIPEEDLSKIFKRYYQSKNSAHNLVNGQSGTGIGLYLCRSIVSQLGGVITAVNNKRAGSSFRILLPLQREENRSEYDPAIDTVILDEEDEQQMAANFAPDKLTILIVEDHPDMRSFIRSILTEHYNVLEAGDGREALTILNRKNIDFVISDLMMPVMDGVELSRRMKENFVISHIPVLMLTAKTSQEARIESYKTGVDAYLSKPFSEELLLARITNILENRKRYHQQFLNNMDVAELQMEDESNDKIFLKKALKILNENYQNPEYESDNFIYAMGVSKSVLNKKINMLTGQSIGQFIRNYRLNIAHELIEKNKTTRNMNISEIAYEVGFNDPKYFTRCFTKRFNFPPSILMNEGDK